MKFLDAPESIRASEVFSALSARVCRVVINDFFDDKEKHSIDDLHCADLVEARAAASDQASFPSPILMILIPLLLLFLLPFLTPF